MNDDRFPAALAAVLRFEGGFVDDPRDAGGATNMGITQAVLSQARGRPANALAVRALSAAEAGAIYRRLFWRPAGCDRLAAGLDLLMFDSAVNMGVEAAARLLQGAAGLTADGAIGPQSLAALARLDAADVISGLAQRREARYRALPDFAIFGAGWLRRLNAMAALARDWAGAPAPIETGRPA